MPEIVFVCNYGDNDFIDTYANEEVCIKSKGYIPMIYNKAIFFVGNGTESDNNRVVFRRGGVVPTLTIYEKVEDVPLLKELSVLEEKLEETLAEQQGVAFAPDTIHSGKYVGQLWEDVLSPENFNAAYWNSTVKVMKSIPADTKDRIKRLLKEKEGNNQQ